MSSAKKWFCIDCGVSVKRRIKRCSECHKKFCRERFKPICTRKRFGKKNAFFGKRHTEETKRKLREAQKGKVSSFLGKHHSEESKKKMSETSKGQITWNKGKTNIYSEETKQKLREANIGKRHTEETKKKMSEARKGKKRSEETKRKLSESKKGEKNPAWRGGTSDRYRLCWLDRGWEEIRKQCYKRDNHTCQICGKTKIKVSAHHIIPWRISKDNSLENLITLCSKCHGKEEHKYYNSLLNVQ